MQQGLSATGDPANEIEWEISAAPVDYPVAVAAMEARVQAIRAGTAAELVWLLEHPPLYTAGTSAKPADLLAARFPVYETGRGGQYTYHGPGQRIAYVMLDLQRRGPDLRRYIWTLEEWLILALREFDVRAERREGRVGLWVDLSRYGRVGEAKIAAIGVRVRQWVTYHGIALNVAPDLAHYDGIVPCGISRHGVTSLADLGIYVSMDEVDGVLRRAGKSVGL
jgi:lipoyl(octanoyl) transferase